MLPAAHAASAPSLAAAAAVHLGHGPHLVVLQHGLYGSRADMQLLMHRLAARLDDGVSVCMAVSNEGRTLDGVHAGGLRLADEVAAHVRARAGGARPVERVSFVGHSLGGLYCRFAIGVLEERGFFARCRPVAYVSFATPHLGARRAARGFFNWALHAGGDHLLGLTGRQLMLRDADADHVAYAQHDGSPRFGVPGLSRRRPLLRQLADPTLPFVRGLGRFRERVAVANVDHDMLVTFSTAAVQPYNPFALGERVPVPLAGYAGVLEGDAVALAWEHGLRQRLRPADPPAAAVDAPQDAVFAAARSDPYFRLRQKDGSEHIIDMFEHLAALRWVRVGVALHGDWYAHVRMLGKQLSGNARNLGHVHAGDDESLEMVRGFGVVSYVVNLMHSAQIAGEIEADSSSDDVPGAEVEDDEWLGSCA